MCTYYKRGDFFYIVHFQLQGIPGFRSRDMNGMNARPPRVTVGQMALNFN